MKVLVTGGAGTLGRSVVKDLLAHDFAVRVLDRNTEGLKEMEHPSLEVISGDIRDQSKIRETLNGVEIIYHLAETYSSDPYEVLDTDIKGNLNLLTAAAESGIKHFLFVSSHRVYGRPRYLPIDEEHPLHPEESGRAVYAAAKIANEKMCLAFWKERNLPVTIFRPWWSFSPNIRGQILRNMIDAALKGEVIRVPEHTGGNFVHNDDAALAMRLAVLKIQAYGEAFNLTSGVFITWRELAGIVVGLTASPSRLEIIPESERAGDPLGGTDPSVYYECRLDIDKSKRLIGYQPQHNPTRVKELLKETIERLVQARKRG
ncbi:MAG: SDR family NAD(P)-dependent oxidoreductase [Chloroflexota bacterium]